METLIYNLSQSQINQM